MGVFFLPIFRRLDGRGARFEAAVLPVGTVVVRDTAWVEQARALAIVSRRAAGNNLECVPNNKAGGTHGKRGGAIRNRSHTALDGVRVP